MDELDVLRGLRNKVPPATQEALLRSRAALLRELEQPRKARARLAWLPAGPIRWRMAAGAGLAAALTIALFATQGVRGPQEEAAANVEAARVLRNAAMVAQREQILPARPDQFVFIESVIAYRGEHFSCDGRADQSQCTPIPDAGPIVPKLRQQWLSVDGTRDGLLRERPQSGDGTWKETPWEVCPAGVRAVDATGRAIACVPVPHYHADLPTNAEDMLQYLRQRAQRNREVYQNVGDSYVFTIAGDLIRDGYVPPASLAAMFEAMTRVPGLTVARDAADAAGRRGISVGWEDHGVRVEIVFDAVTYAYLGERTIALQDANGRKKGEIVGSARLRLAIVDRPGQLP